MKLIFNKPEVSIWTDGSYRSNTQTGGWAAYLESNGEFIVISDRVVGTTNNRMELQAVLSALQLLRVPSIVTISSDSMYVLNTIKKYLPIVSKGGIVPPDIPNADIIIPLIYIASYHQVTTKWVKGHSNVLYNELCDAHAYYQSGRRD